MATAITQKYTGRGKTRGTALDQIASSFTQINECNLVIASAAEQQAQVARVVDTNLSNIRNLAIADGSRGHADQRGQSGSLAPGGFAEWPGVEVYGLRC